MRHSYKKERVACNVLSDMFLRIPHMEVVALERLAATAGETVSAVLARELRDLCPCIRRGSRRKCPDSPRR